MSTRVRAWTEPVVIPTYAPAAPDRNPMFLEKRVYQGSAGTVYPLPFIDRVAERKTNRTWRAVFLENEFLRVMILPEIGGRIHRMVDKTNGYDLIYYQPTIKPALVGLAGPWISGGIEFNWPQHHRPSTFMPVDEQIEAHADGSITIWLSEHDPMARMKGMHGVCLRPGKAYLELKVRAYNRTADVQTFLWWANVAVRVHEQYQSFFPPDVSYVADHARRALSTYPLCSGRYYGVDYAARGRDGVPPAERPRQYVPLLDQPKTQNPKPKKRDRLTYRPNDLSWYANIPVPTSYMCMGSREDFFGGYDHRAQAGLIHLADHHISPGKKQWTWGNHEFGYAWDRNLTEADERGEFAPYIELMAGVYTDNQPDFSFLQPGETKTWSQYWYPIQKIGSAQHANLDVAVSLRCDGTTAHIGVAVTAPNAAAIVQLETRGRSLARWSVDLAPDRPFVSALKLAHGRRASDLTVRILATDGRELLHYTPHAAQHGAMPPPATEPAAPADIPSSDELYLTGLHLEQYRHATRRADDYWREALRRDPGDARCHLALGRWRLRRGEFAAAEQHLRASIARLTLRNPNPADGEAYYQLGRCLLLEAQSAPRDPKSKIENRKLEAAYDSFYKATWNHAWQAAGYHALAEIDCVRNDWLTALDHLDRALCVNTDNLRARDLKALVLRRLGRDAEAVTLLRATLALDPLDWWARHLKGDELRCATQVRLDLALDYARSGFLREALAVLATAHPEPHSGTAPLVSYYRAWLCNLMGYSADCRRHLRTAAQSSPDYCFPARLEEIVILEFAIAANPHDARAPFYLGNLLYDRRRHREAIAHWERAVRLEPANAVAWRNLGIGYYNILGQPARARRAYAAAFHADPTDARLLFERDQLWKRLGTSPARRLRELAQHPVLVARRDDLSIELCALYNQTGQPAKALAIVSSRKFQPWEGGEGQALGQHVRTHVLLGRAALARGDAPEARRLFASALASPPNLGEAKHLLANQSDLHFWLGEACTAAGDRAAAKTHWHTAAKFQGDFQEMSVRAFSEMTYYSALALARLGRKTQARQLLRDLLGHARSLAKAGAKIDYFATSLPTMLLFDEDLPARQRTTAKFLEAQARLGLGQPVVAHRLLASILRRAPNHALAADLLAR